MSLHDTKKPIGEVNMQRVTESPDPNDYLLERMLSRANMRQAWKRVKANQGAPGADDMAIDQFPAFARNKWPDIRQSLLAGTYLPKPVKRVEIPKPTGGTRPLGIPTILDRLIQQAIAQVLVPIFDPDFSDHSHGFRPGRSAHDAVRKVQGYIKQGYRFAVDMDLERFFDTVNHDVLMHRVARKVRDKRLLKLISKYLRAGVLVNGAKSRVAKTDQTTFLGFTFKGTKIRWSDRAFAEFKRRVTKLTGMTNKWLKDQGLLSVKELWVSSCLAVVFNEGGSTTQLGLGRPCEPPSADPQARLVPP